MSAYVSGKNMFERFLHSQVVGSIILIAATDVVGFFSFLGLATYFLL